MRFLNWLAILCLCAPQAVIAQSWTPPVGTIGWTTGTPGGSASYPTATQACARQHADSGGPGEFWGSNTGGGADWTRRHCDWQFILGNSRPDWVDFRCAAGYIAVPFGKCVAVDNRSRDPRPCDGIPDPSTPNPINIRSGSKRLAADDFTTADGWLRLRRIFNSLPYGQGGYSLVAPAWGMANFIPDYAYEMQLAIEWDDSSKRIASVVTPDGGTYRFRADPVAKVMVPDLTVGNVPQQEYSLSLDDTWPSDLSTIVSAVSHWTLRETDGRVWKLATVQEQQGSNQYRIGRPVSVTDPLGASSSFRYEQTDTLIQIADSFGRQIIFNWILVNGLPKAIAKAYLPDGTSVNYIYDTLDPSGPSLPDRLARVERVDGSGTLLEKVAYTYADPYDPLLVTSVLDKGGSAVWTITYDEHGRALTSAGPNGVGGYTVNYGTDATPTTDRTVTNALGKATTYSYARSSLAIDDMMLKTVNGQMSPNCPASSASLSYSTNGFLAGTVDEEGRQTSYAFNGKGRITHLVEAQSRPEQRTTDWSWSSNYAYPTDIVSQGSTTHYDFDTATAPAGAATLPAHRFWRIRFQSNVAGSGNTGFSEVEFISQNIGEANVAFTGPLTSSPPVNSQGPALAVDALFGDASITFDGASHNFVTGVLSGFLGLDLGAGYSPLKVINGVVITGFDSALSSSNVKAFDLQFSDVGGSNDVDWTTSWSVAGQGSWGNFERRTFLRPGFVTPPYTGSPHGPHRYWRLVLLGQSHPDAGWAIGEIDLRATPGGQDQTGSGTAFASSELSTSNTAAQAFDSSGVSYWGSTAFNPFGNVKRSEYIGYDFGVGHAVSVSSITLTAPTFANDNQMPSLSMLQFADDGVSWTTAARFFDNSAWSQAEVRSYTDPLYIAP